MSSLFSTRKRYFQHKRTGLIGYYWLDNSPVINKERITITESPNPIPPGYHPAKLWQVGGIHVLNKGWLEEDWIEVENQI